MKGISSILIIITLLFTACIQDKTEISLTEQGELLAQDSIIIEYLTGVALLLKLSREGDISIIHDYHALLEKENSNHCELKKEAFNGNQVLEEYANIKCHVDILGKKVRDKYPDLKEMNAKDKKILFAPAFKLVKFDVDVELMKQKGKDLYNALSEKEKIEYHNKAKNLFTDQND